MAFERKATLAGLTLPIEDHEYTIPPVDADLGLFLTELTATIAAAEASPDDRISPEQAARLVEMAKPLQDADSIARLLSPEVLEQMKTDGVPWQRIQLAASTVMIWTVNGETAAEQHWNAGGRTVPKAPTDRRPKKATPTKKK